MRFFDLFLRRAGVDRATAQGRRRGTSRLTVICPRDELGSLRKQICLTSAPPAWMFRKCRSTRARIPAWRRPASPSTAPELRGELMSQARRLSANPAVRHVHFGVQPLAA